MSRKNHRRGFTLTELLVVCAVIIILMSILIVCVDGLYAYALQVKCQHHLEQIWGACVMYASANQGMYPAAWTYGAAGGTTNCAWNDLLTTLRYLDDKGVIGCPATELPETSGSDIVNTGTPMNNTTTTILGALRWFKNNQQANGSWPIADAANCSDGNPTTSSQSAMALLSFLGFGVNDTHPEFGDCVRRGVQFLCSSAGQNKTTGSFSSSGSYAGYADGLATMAVCEAYRLIQDPDLKEQARAAAQLAVNRLTINVPNVANFNGGYTPYGGGTTGASCDNSVSSWCNQGVIAGHLNGLSVSQTEIDHINNRLNTCWINPRVYSTPVGYVGSTPYYMSSQHPRSYWRMTAATFACRLLNGQERTDADVITQGNWLVSNIAGSSYIDLASEYNLTHAYSDSFGTPAGASAHGGVYYGYYVTLGMFLMGDTAGKKYWTDWANVYIPNLINIKTVVSDTPGQEVYCWPKTLCMYCYCYGGTAFSTALACMALDISVAQYTPGTRYYLAGQLSYGYNRRLGLNRGQPSPDTIAIMDYTRSTADSSDPPSYVATRHGGKANVMFTDGHVRTMTSDELLTTDKTTLKPGLLTPVSGD